MFTEGLQQKTRSVIAADGATQDFLLTDAAVRRYSVGSVGPSGTGTVFYVDKSGMHGLEAALPGWARAYDDPVCPWSNVVDPVAPTRLSVGSGAANSEVIVSQIGHARSAAALCKAFRGGSKDDWFLPSIDELKEMRSQKILTGRRSDAYWSSSDNPEDPAMAFCLMIGPGSSCFSTEPMYKLAEFFVRPVRAF